MPDLSCTEPEFIGRVAPLTRSLMWFLGAGASRAAGMPTASDIIWDLKRRYYCLQENQDLQAHNVNNQAVRAKRATGFAGDRPRPGNRWQRQYSHSRKSNRRDRTGWLGWEDSNSQMSLPKLAFEVWPEFPFILERLAIRDFSRLSCQRVTCTPVHSAMNMARRSPLRCGQAMLERRLLWIREFESLPQSWSRIS